MPTVRATGIQVEVSDSIRLEDLVELARHRFTRDGKNHVRPASVPAVLDLANPCGR